MFNCSPLSQVQTPPVFHKPMCHALAFRVPRFWISLLINCHSSSVSMETKSNPWSLQTRLLLFQSLTLFENIWAFETGWLALYEKNQYFNTGTQDLGHTYSNLLCLKEHAFTHWPQWTRLVTCGKGKFRWLDYPNLNALDESCEIYNFDSGFFRCRRCKGKILSRHFFFRNICPDFFLAHYV